MVVLRCRIMLKDVIYFLFLASETRAVNIAKSYYTQENMLSTILRDLSDKTDDSHW